MIPNLNKFYTYDGSLTTPPLNEAVKWIVLGKPLYVSSQGFSDDHLRHRVIRSIYAFRAPENPYKVTKWKFSEAFSIFTAITLSIIIVHCNPKMDEQSITTLNLKLNQSFGKLPMILV